MTPDLFTVRLEKLVYGGDALGRLPDPRAEAGGRAVFVPFGLPGEQVRVRVTEEKRGHARAELVEILRPSPKRIQPRCRHFGRCGGCHYQHLPYAEQLQVKREILIDQLERIGKIDHPPVQPMIPSSQEWNYRNHIQFHLTPEGELGFMSSTLHLSPSGRSMGVLQEEARGGGVIPITECHLPEPPLNSLWPQLKFEPGLGLERVALRLGQDEAAMLMLVSANPEPPELEIEADISVVHLCGEDAVVMAGEETLPIAVGGMDELPQQRTFRVSAASFFQVNTPMAGRMVAHLLSRLPLTPQTTLLDVYCGVGLFSAFLAPQVGRLIGIEASPSACADFTANLDEFEHVELYEAPAEQVLPALELSVDIILVDPPRAGLDRRVVEAVLARGTRRLAYVSCDPSTLGRDAARLIAGGYRLVEVTPFDLFPQTYSIESVSMFEKAE